MNIQSSSFARLDTGNLGGSVNESVKERLKKIYAKIPENWRKIDLLQWLDIENLGRSVNESVKERLKKIYGKILQNWGKIVLIACVVALAIDPLFLLIPEIDSDKTCFTFNKELGVAVCVLRTYIDIVYLMNFYFPVKTMLTGQSLRSLRDVLNVLSKAVRDKRSPSFYFMLIADSVSVLPIPQAVVLSVIFWSTSLVPIRKSIRLTKWIIVGQYVPRIIRLWPLYKEVTKTSGTIAESKWIGASLNFSLFMLCSYVFGALWYVNGVQNQSRCWRDVCANTSGCNPTKLFCQDVDNSLFLNTSCPLIDSDKITHSSNVYDFGMYIEVLKSRVAEIKQTNFPRKFVYCFWWGLRNLSTFGTNLKPDDSLTDILFAVIICASGLFLFAVLIGNVQKYMISTTVRVEEMKERQRDREKWMSFRKLPVDLKERITKYDEYKWQNFRGTDEDALLRSLPIDLRLETKRHLYKDHLKKNLNHVKSHFVGFPETMNDWLLEALCDRVKSVNYSANSCIMREGGPEKEILIVTKGDLKCTPKYGEDYELKEGDVCGDLRNPTSNSTVMTLTDVEGFIILPDDLKFVASHLEQRRSECSSSSEPQKSADPKITKDEA